MIHVNVSGASRPKPTETENGDLWLQWQTDTDQRIAVIDGVGHGPQAAIAAAELARFVVEAGKLPFDLMFRRASEAIARTRGAVMSIAVIEGERLTFVGLGNVEGRIYQNEKEHRFTADRGIIGTSVRTLHPQSHELEAPWLALLYSDGISGRFRLDSTLAASLRSDPAAGAAALLAAHGRVTDDATLVVITSD